ncbi:MAG TPA: endo-1,4-beta-xylanase [Rhizomicrobium sp.]|nr:endo-1,4-beta-xylanase [Rhizomicrobium sp.]
MMTRRAFTAAASAALCAPAFAQPPPGGSPRLCDLAAARGLFFGAATNNYWQRDSDFTQALLDDCAIIVPEYELKRDLIEPVRGQYDFSASDALLSFARANELLFRGHPLVWYASNPPWLEDAVANAKDERIITDYIAAVCHHYRGQIHSWDVVNEAIEPADGGLRNSLWLKRFGPGYIETAFRAARQADPHALLVYNDYSLEEAGPVYDARRRATLDLLGGLKARGVPVDALGLQAHLSAFGHRIDQKVLREFLDAVGAMGLRILVTEHDVDDSDGPLDADARDAAVADISRRFLDVVLDNSATLGVLTWGLSDRYLKYDGTRDALLRGTPRKLPLDRNMMPTALHAALAAAFRGARGRHV